jgi:opacity protein-like surface antigen
MPKKLLISSLCLLASQAQAHLHPYLSLGLGAVFPSQDIEVEGNSTYDLYNPTAIGTSIFQLPNIDWDSNLQTGFETNLIAGVHLTPHWRAEGEFLYQNMMRDMGGTYSWEERYATTGALAFSATGRPLSDSDMTVNVFSLMTNLVYDFKNTTKWTPFAGAGLGIAWISSNSTTEDNVLVTQTSGTQSITPTTEFSPMLYGTAFAWQLKAGVNYTWTEQMSFDLAYRLFVTSEFEQKNGQITTNPDNPGYIADFFLPQGDVNGLIDNSIFVSFRYTFK